MRISLHSKLYMCFWNKSWKHPSYHFRIFFVLCFQQRRQFIIQRISNWSIDHHSISSLQVVPQLPLSSNNFHPSKVSVILDVIRNKSKQFWKQHHSFHHYQNQTVSNHYILLLFLISILAYILKYHCTSPFNFSRRQQHHLIYM